MRRTASRAQIIVPNTLIANMRCQRASVISSTRAATSTTPALLTSAASGPSSRSMVANIATHVGLDGHVGGDGDRSSARASMSATTARAAASFVA